VVSDEPDARISRVGSEKGIGATFMDKSPLPQRRRRV
jgi:hypothetical protein